jgi:hypothetical protein
MSKQFHYDLLKKAIEITPINPYVFENFNAIDTFDRSEGLILKETKGTAVYASQIWYGPTIKEFNEEVPSNELGISI